MLAGTLDQKRMEKSSPLSANGKSQGRADDTEEEFERAIEEMQNELNLDNESSYSYSFPNGNVQGRFVEDDEANERKGSWLRRDGYSKLHKPLQPQDQKELGLPPGFLNPSPKTTRSTASSVPSNSSSSASSSSSPHSSSSQGTTRFPSFVSYVRRGGSKKGYESLQQQDQGGPAKLDQDEGKENGDMIPGEDNVIRITSQGTVEGEEEDDRKENRPAVKRPSIQTALRNGKEHSATSENTSTNSSHIGSPMATKGLLSPSTNQAAASSSSSSSSSSVTPLPLFQLSLLGACLYGVLFSQNSIFPYLPKYVRHFFPEMPTTDLGYRAGYLGSAFMVGTTVSSYPIGLLADTIGRRPCLLLGLLATVVSMLMFGFSTSFEMGVGARLIGGLLNGNNGLVKSIVSEISDDSNMASAFALIGLCGGIARLSAPAVGGFTADPAYQYPDNPVLNSQFFRDWPYSLPCLIGAGIAAISFVLVGGFLRETLPPKGLRKGKGESRAQNEQGNSSHSGSTSASLVSLLRNRSIALMVGMNAILQLLSVAQIECFPLWSVLSRKDGGLDFEEKDIAIVLTVIGTFQFFHQLFFYPRLASWLGFKRLFRFGILIVGITSFAMPFNYYLGGISTNENVNRAFLWIGVCLVFVILVCARVSAFTCCFVLLNNVCTSDIKGSANGLAQSAASIAGSVAPILFATLFAWSVSSKEDHPQQQQQHIWPLDFTLVWTLMGFISVGSAWLIGFLPDSANSAMKSEDQEMEQVVLTELEGGEGETHLQGKGDGDDRIGQSSLELDEEDVLSHDFDADEIDGEEKEDYQEESTSPRH